MLRRKKQPHHDRPVGQFGLLVDLYDISKYPDNWYSRKNPFDAKKTTPL